jgi:hypothetical protein
LLIYFYVIKARKKIAIPSENLLETEHLSGILSKLGGEKSLKLKRAAGKFMSTQATQPFCCFGK